MGSNNNKNCDRGGRSLLNIKLPKKMKIGVHYYDVIFPYHFKEDNGFFGQIDYALLEIRISDMDTNGNLRPASKVMETFWHEIQHAIDYEYNNDKIMDKFGEDTIKTLARAFMQVLYDNHLVVHKEFIEPQQEQQVNESDKALFTGQPRNQKEAVFMSCYNEFKGIESLSKVMS